MISPSKTNISFKKEIDIWVSQNSVFTINYTRWCCGITRNPNIRKTQHMRKLNSEPCYFNVWCAKSLRIASSLEASFHNKGIKDKDLTGGVKNDSYYIYVHKLRPTILDVL